MSAAIPVDSRGSGPVRDLHPQPRHQQSPNDPLPRTARPAARTVSFRVLPLPVSFEPVVLHWHAAGPIAADARPSREPASRVMGRDPGRWDGRASRIEPARASRLRRPDVLSGGAEPRVGPSPKRYATGHVPLAPSGVRGHPGGLRAHGGPALGRVVHGVQHWAVGPLRVDAQTEVEASPVQHAEAPAMRSRTRWDGIFR